MLSRVLLDPVDTLALTHWGQDKMAAISQTTFSNAFSWMKLFKILIKMSLKFLPKDVINISVYFSVYLCIYDSLSLNELKLRQPRPITSYQHVMACHLFSTKPLQEPMMSAFSIHAMEPCGTNFRGMSIKIQTFSFRKCIFENAVIKWQQPLFGPNVLSSWMVFELAVKYILQ